MDDTKGPLDSGAETDEAMERRDFMREGAKLAAGAGILGAMGLAAKPAEAATTPAACGPNPSVMEVTFDFHTSGRPDMRQLQEHIMRSGEQLSSVFRRMTDENGWGEWLRDASGDDDWADMRAVSFKHIPFRTGGGR